MRSETVNNVFTIDQINQVIDEKLNHLNEEFDREIDENDGRNEQMVVILGIRRRQLKEMKNILKNITIEDMHFRRVDECIGIGMSFGEERTDDPQHPLEDRGNFNNFYRLNLSVYCQFAANTADYEPKRKHAERQLAFHLYKDIIDEVNQALNAVSSGDKQAAIKCLVRLRSDLMESI